MKVLTLTDPLIFSCVPREFPISTDNLELILINEITKLEITPAFTFTVGQKLTIEITTQPIDFKPKNRYLSQIKKDGKIIYLGLIITLEKNTDKQNYTYATQSTSKVKFR